MRCGGGGARLADRLIGRFGLDFSNAKVVIYSFREIRVRFSRVLV
jgi:hypothetical protein